MLTKGNVQSKQKTHTDEGRKKTNLKEIHKETIKQEREETHTQ